MNCHLTITRVKFVYLIDACVLRRKLNWRFHNKRRRGMWGSSNHREVVHKGVSFMC